MTSRIFCGLTLQRGQNTHSVGDFGTCSAPTLVHKTEFVLHRSKLNTALSRW